MPIVAVLCLYGVFLWIGIAAARKASGGGRIGRAIPAVIG
jgi:hypothetical protein